MPVGITVYFDHSCAGANFGLVESTLLIYLTAASAPVGAASEDVLSVDALCGFSGRVATTILFRHDNDAAMTSAALASGNVVLLIGGDVWVGLAVAPTPMVTTTVLSTQPPVLVDDRDRSTKTNTTAGTVSWLFPVAVCLAVVLAAGTFFVRFASWQQKRRRFTYARGLAHASTHTMPRDGTMPTDGAAKFASTWSQSNISTSAGSPSTDSSNTYGMLDVLNTGPNSRLASSTSSGSAEWSIDGAAHTSLAEEKQIWDLDDVAAEYGDTCVTGELFDAGLATNEPLVFPVAGTASPIPSVGEQTPDKDVWTIDDFSDSDDAPAGHRNPRRPSRSLFEAATGLDNAMTWDDAFDVNMVPSDDEPPKRSGSRKGKRFGADTHEIITGTSTTGTVVRIKTHHIKEPPIVAFGV